MLCYFTDKGSIQIFEKPLLLLTSKTEGEKKLHFGENNVTFEK